MCSQEFAEGIFLLCFDACCDVMWFVARRVAHDARNLRRTSFFFLRRSRRRRCPRTDYALAPMFIHHAPAHTRIAMLLAQISRAVSRTPAQVSLITQESCMRRFHAHTQCVRWSAPKYWISRCHKRSLPSTENGCSRLISQDILHHLCDVYVLFPPIPPSLFLFSPSFRLYFNNAHSSNTHMCMLCPPFFFIP